MKTLTAQTFKTALKKHYPLLVLLAACAVVWASMATYTNWDAELEYEATTSVLSQGIPYISTGMTINQPPLGFYTAASAFKLFGESYQNGVILSGAFGLGCVAMVYALGTVLYGRRTGLGAAAVFGFTPWHVFMSRIFLIDNECMFLGLMFLVLGVVAVRRNSEKLLLSAGIVFGLALMTKLFAVFLLIPLLLIIYFNRKEPGFRITRRAALIFAAPTLIMQFIWYGLISNENFVGVYFNTDFFHPNRVADPNMVFVPATLVDSAGVFVFVAVTFAVSVAIGYRKRLGALLKVDAACFLTVLAVTGVNSLLVFLLHMNPPYISVVKYSYMALPFFCLLAASVLDKVAVLLAGLTKRDRTRWLKRGLIAFGAALIFVSLLESTLFLNKWYPFASFGVDTISYYPFFLKTDAPPLGTMLLMQYGGLVLAVFSLFLEPLMTQMKRSLRTLHIALKS